MFISESMTERSDSQGAWLMEDGEDDLLQVSGSMKG